MPLSPPMMKQFDSVRTSTFRRTRCKPSCFNFFLSTPICFFIPTSITCSSETPLQTLFVRSRGTGEGNRHFYTAARGQRTPMSSHLTSIPEAVRIAASTDPSLDSALKSQALEYLQKVKELSDETWQVSSRIVYRVTLADNLGLSGAVLARCRSGSRGERE